MFDYTFYAPHIDEPIMRQVSKLVIKAGNYVPIEGVEYKVTGTINDPDNNVRVFVMREPAVKKEEELEDNSN